MMRYFIFGILAFLLFACSDQTDSGLQNALDNGHIAKDINEADGFTPPQGSLLINDGVVSTNKTDVTLKLAASDAVGVTAYYVSSQSVSPSISDSNWNSVTSTTSFSKQVYETISSVEKSLSFYAWYRDAVGGTSTQVSASIIYDVTVPATPFVSMNSGESSTTNTVVSLTISATDSVGVTSYYASETNSDPVSTDSGWISVTSSTSYSATVEFTLTSATSAGNHSRTVYVWFKDAAGNVSVSASDDITLVVTDITAPTNPSISINSGASSTASSSVTLSLSATDDLGVSAYFLSSSSSAPSSTASGWKSITATTTTSYSASVSYTLSGSGTTTLYVWFKDTAGNVSSSASDSITYESIPNIYCGSTNTNSGGTTAFNATKITNNSTYSVTLGSGEHAYYFFTATSGNSYSISYSSTEGVSFKVYKGVGNRVAYEYGSNSFTTISSYSGNVIIYFDQNVYTPTVTFQIIGTISNPFSSTNSYCQQSVTKGSSAFNATSVGLDKIYSISLSSGEESYFSFSANASSSYNIAYSSTQGISFKVYKGVGNRVDYEYDHDEASSISSFSGSVIIHFEQNVYSPTVDFMVTK